MRWSSLARLRVVKGRTNIKLLIGFQTAEDLGFVLVANSVQSNETAISNLVGEYADLFKGIGINVKGMQVDLHVNPAILPLAQPHRRPKLEVELEMT